MWFHFMVNLTVYVFKVSNSRRVDRHLSYPGKLRSHWATEFPGQSPNKAAAMWSLDQTMWWGSQ